MTKLSVNKIQQKLIERDEVKKATYEKQKLSANRNRKEVGKPKDLSTSVTKITQVEVPGGKGKMSVEKSKGSVPQADRADQIVDKMSMPTYKKSENEKSPKSPSVSSDKPNQTTKLKQITKTIMNTEDGGSSKMGIPAAEAPDKTVNKMAHGNKNLGKNGDSVPTVKAPKAASLNSTTRPKGGVRTASFNTKDSKSVDQTKSPRGSLPEPSDSPKKPTWKTEKNGHNVTEATLTSVNMMIGGKMKGRFEFISEGVAKKLADSYKNLGYKVEFSRARPAWMDDKEFLSLMREAVDARYNFVIEMSKDARKKAFERFRKLAQDSFIDLYESRQDWINHMTNAFKHVEKMVEAKYVENLNLYECTVRITQNRKPIDLTIVTEATDHAMALRQVKNRVFENWGFKVSLKHIFVDGTKYLPEQIVSWSKK